MSSGQNEAEWDKLGHTPIGCVLCPTHDVRKFDNMSGTAKDTCSDCNSENIKIGITNISSGATVYPKYCDDCGRVMTKYVKRRTAIQYAINNGPMKYVKTKTAQFYERKNITIMCRVCNAVGAEMHHWAPKHIFGDEAERWPKDLLCRTCHARWHNMVTPNMAQMKEDGREGR